jgi:UDP-N-acetylmuramoylalanine--D-glutamate ligase
VEAARYLARQGVEVTVTDLRDEEVLAPSIAQLAGLPIRYVLGRHDIEDFRKADMVVKNPAVPADSPYLRAAREAGGVIETDISLFLAARRDAGDRIIAVTGSKGKSTTASALHWALGKAREAGLRGGKALLGGNIARSPLPFLEEMGAEDDVVLELSSWQLGDLRDKPGLLKPRIAVITAIMADHQDRYPSMEAYVADKQEICRAMDAGDALIAGGDGWGKSFRALSRARPLIYGPHPLQNAWLGEDGAGFARLPGGKEERVLPPQLLTPGVHQKQNLLAAALALLDLGLPAPFIYQALADYPGLEHRLEYFLERQGIRFYNDSAATIPEAAAAAIRSFPEPPILICGGTDKNLDFSPLADAAPLAKALILLAGTGTAKLTPLLAARGIPWQGPFDSLEAALEAALSLASPGDAVVLSPGCASFGMFLNEFDRGRQWKNQAPRGGFSGR